MLVSACAVEDALPALTLIGEFGSSSKSGPPPVEEPSVIIAERLSAGLAVLVAVSVTVAPGVIVDGATYRTRFGAFCVIEPAPPGLLELRVQFAVVLASKERPCPAGRLADVGLMVRMAGELVTFSSTCFVSTA